MVRISKMKFLKCIYICHLLLPLAASTENVYLTSSYNQLVSSSTLRWRSIDLTTKYYLDHPSVVHADKGVAVCRGWYQGQRVAGGTTDPKGHCSVTFFEKRHLLEKYEVLIDTTSTTKLEWQKWDIFQKRPHGLVAFNDHAFVTRVKAKEQAAGRQPTEKYFVGELDPLRGLSGNIAVAYGDDDSVEFVTEGEILVEIEPYKYELRDAVFMKDRAKTSQEFVPLGSKVLVNIEDEDTNVTQVITGIIAYNATYHYYWGHLQGLIRTLPSSGETLDNHGRLEFHWGLPLTFKRHRILEVSHSLMPGTSLNVSAEARKQTTEVPYTALLVSHFSDDTTKERQIEGSYVETVFADVNILHEGAYFTKNGSLVPTTTSVSTTTTTTVTTTTPTTATTSFTFPSLRPLRTTTPLPTTENPLLKFYPADGEVENEIDTGSTWDATLNRKVGKHNTRSSPVSDRWTEGGMSGTSRIFQTSFTRILTFLAVLSYLL